MVAEEVVGVTAEGEGVGGLAEWVWGVERVCKPIR